MSAEEELKRKQEAETEAADELHEEMQPDVAEKDVADEVDGEEPEAVAAEKDDCAKLEEDFNKLKNDYISLYAEMDNMKKREQQENERQKKRSQECDGYLEEARRLKSKRSYKDALDMIQRAREMKIKEKREEIDALEEAVRKEKKESGWFGRFRDKILNEVWDDETSKK